MPEKWLHTFFCTFSWILIVHIQKLFVSNDAWKVARLYLLGFSNSKNLSSKDQNVNSFKCPPTWQPFAKFLNKSLRSQTANSHWYYSKYSTNQLIYISCYRGCPEEISKGSTQFQVRQNMYCRKTPGSDFLRTVWSQIRTSSTQCRTIRARLCDYKI